MADQPTPKTSPSTAADNKDSVVEPTTDANATAKASDEAKTPKQAKTAPADGFVTPVDFAKEIDKHLGQVAGTTKPQIVYGYVKNGKDFPVTERPGMFPKFVVNLAKGLAWVDAKNVRKAERDAAKAAKAAEAPKEETPATA